MQNQQQDLNSGQPANPPTLEHEYQPASSPAKPQRSQEKPFFERFWFPIFLAILGSILGYYGKVFADNQQVEQKQRLELTQEVVKTINERSSRLRAFHSELTRVLARGPGEKDRIRNDWTNYYSNFVLPYNDKLKAYPGKLRNSFGKYGQEISLAFLAQDHKARVPNSVHGRMYQTHDLVWQLKNDCFLQFNTFPDQDWCTLDTVTVDSAKNALRHLDDGVIGFQALIEKRLSDLKPRFLYW